MYDFISALIFAVVLPISSWRIMLAGLVLVGIVYCLSTKPLRTPLILIAIASTIIYAGADKLYTMTFLQTSSSEWSSQTPAQIASAISGARMHAALFGVIIPAAISSILFLFYHKQRKKEGVALWGVIGAFFLLLAYFGWAELYTVKKFWSGLEGREAIENRAPAARPATSSAPRVVSEAGKVIAAYTYEPAGGMTQRDVDVQYVEQLAQRVRESLASKVVRNYRDMQITIDPADISVRAEGNIIPLESGKIVVIKAQVDEMRDKNQVTIIRAVRLVRLQGDALQVVTCIRNGTEEFNIWSGPCGERIAASFGISVPPE